MTDIAVLVERHGYYVDKFDGEDRYMTRDDKHRAIVGPKRHRAPGLLSFGRKRKAPFNQTLERVITKEDVMKHQRQDPAETVRIALPKFEFGGLRPTHVPPVKPSRWERVKGWFKTMAYDEEWHQAAVRVAGTLVAWVATVAIIVSLIKGMSWLLSV